MDMHPPRYGVLGVGALASAIVTGLCDGVADPPVIVLSPRNAEAAAGLAARFDSVSVAADNQAVLDAAELVFVALRRVARRRHAELIGRPEHVVVSADPVGPHGPAQGAGRSGRPGGSRRAHAGRRQPQQPNAGAPASRSCGRGLRKARRGDADRRWRRVRGDLHRHGDRGAVLRVPPDPLRLPRGSRPLVRRRATDRARPTPGCWSFTRGPTRVRTSPRWSRSTRRPAAATPSSPP